MGEKFAANPVTGTGSMTVPIATSPRPLRLWPATFALLRLRRRQRPVWLWLDRSRCPSITRKTDKGLPQYLDAEESDVFILSGAEDLVPDVRKGCDGNWVIKRQSRSTNGRDGQTYRIRRYRPRIEGLFARIERWTNCRPTRRRPLALHLQGQYPHPLRQETQTRALSIPNDPTRIFSWLICETRDDKGNAVVYEYKAEDGDGRRSDPGPRTQSGRRDDQRRPPTAISSASATATASPSSIARGIGRAF